MSDLLTGEEYRHNSRQKVKRYKEAMLAKGYTQFLCFISSEMKTEINSLKELNSWNNIEALEHIFNGYLRMVKNDTSNNEITPKIDKLRESTPKKTSAESKNNSPLYTEQTDTEEIIMSLHKQGLPAIRIATTLSQRGIKNPKGEDRWSTSTITNILKKQAS